MCVLISLFSQLVDQEQEFVRSNLTKLSVPGSPLSLQGANSVSGRAGHSSAYSIRSYYGDSLCTCICISWFLLIIAYNHCKIDQISWEQFIALEVFGFQDSSEEVIGN